MQRDRVAILVSALLLLRSGPGYSAALTFTPRELFRISFGKDRDALGTRIGGGNFLFPRDFTMDGAGHFYIYDTQNHRIVRFSSKGRYEMDFHYPRTAQQVFAHADARQNLRLLISDPSRGMYYGVYDPYGKRLREAIFSQYNRFRLHRDDDAILHVILSSDQRPRVTQTYLLDEESLLLKKENIARPPENHHKISRSDQVYFIDPVPGGPLEDAHQINRITNQSHQVVAAIRGTVIYVTDLGEIYTRVGKREIDVYDVDGSLIGKIHLKGLTSACLSIRFDSAGNLYQLDGIPDQTDEQLRRRVPAVDPNEDVEDLHYTPAMTGMRLILWERR